MDLSAATQTGPKRIFLITLAILASIYIVSFIALPADGFWINDNGAKFIQMQSIVKSHFRNYTIDWPGRDIDPDFKYNPLIEPFGRVYRGKLFGAFSIPFLVLTSPFYGLFGDRGLYILSLLGFFLMLPALWRLSIYANPSHKAASLSLILAALCTPLWFYSLTFWEHLPSTCLVTWGILERVNYHFGGKKKHLASSAVLIGLSVYFRDELYLMPVSLCLVFFLLDRKTFLSTVVYMAIFLLTVIPLWGFQQWALGNPFAHHLLLIPPFESGIMPHLLNRWEIVSNLLLNNHENIYLSVISAIPFAALLAIYPRIPARFMVHTIIGLACISILSGIVIMSGHLKTQTPLLWLVKSNGLFSVSPVLIFSFFKLGHSSEGKPDRPESMRKILWLICLVYIAIYIFLCPPIRSFGIHWGCRYWLYLYPLICVLAASNISQAVERAGVKKSAIIAAVAVVILFSAAMQIFSLKLLFARNSFSSEFNRAVSRYPQQVLITNLWFIPQELAFNFFQKKIFLLGDENDLQAIAEDLKAAGYREALMVIWPAKSMYSQGNVEVLKDKFNFESVSIYPYRL